MLIRVASFSLIPVLLILVLLGCTVESETASEPEEDAVPTSTSEGQARVVEVDHDPIIYQNIEEMIETVEFIFIGTVREQNGHYNLNRDPDNPENPDPHLFGLGQIYLVEVDQYLKGDGESVRQLVQAEGFLSDPNRDVGQSQTQVDLEEARDREDYIPMEPGTQYLFFVDQSIVEPDYLLSISGDPWRYRVDEDTATPEVVASEDALRAIPILSQEYELEEFTEQILASIQDD